MTTQKGKRRIHQNIWGNWNGYEGTRKVKEFGTGHEEAQEWLQGIAPLPPEPLALRHFDFNEQRQRLVLCEPDPSLVKVLGRLR